MFDREENGVITHADLKFVMPELEVKIIGVEMTEILKEADSSAPTYFTKGGYPDTPAMFPSSSTSNTLRVPMNCRHTYICHRYYISSSMVSVSVQYML